MRLKECYDQIGGSYKSIKERISKDEIIQKFVLKFLSEPSFEHLCTAMEEENYVEAFRAAHSLKGVSANLSFERLYQSVSVLTEYLRNSEKKELDKEEGNRLLDIVKKNYFEVIEVIKKLEKA